MRINDTDKQMEMEERDINYILPAYVRSYLFYTKNQMPDRIIFPMFPSVKIGDTEIPIEYLYPTDPVVVEIAVDGSNVEEVTEEHEAEIDAKDEEIKRLKSELEQLQSATSMEREEVGLLPSKEGEVLQVTAKVEEPLVKPKTISKAKAAFATAAREYIETAIPYADKAFSDRQPKLPPGGDIGAGQPLSDTHARDTRAEKHMKRDLAEEPDINEKEEKEFGKDIARDEQGRPVVKE